MPKYPKPQNKRVPFEYVGKNYCIWKLPTQIRSISETIDNCPGCSSELKKDFTLIPVSQDKRVKVNGLLCPHCKCLYTTEAYSVRLIMRGNEFSKEFTLDGKELQNDSFVKKRQQHEIELKQRRREWYQDKKRLLNEIPSSEVLISIQYSNGARKGIIIVKLQCDENNTDNIYHYASEFGREVLSAAFAEERKREGFYNGKTYRVIGKPVFRNDFAKSMSNPLLATELNIKSGGGYFTEIKNNRYEIVDMLVYSPFTSRYELMRATYSKDSCSCFVDISIYRKFVQEYGRPNMMPYFESSGNSLYTGELNEKSILMSYGYAVNRQDNLSTEERQERLAEIIDLEILTAPRIVRFLSLLITIHTHHPDAQLKWKEDIKFVENYKANPQRFLVTGSKRINENRNQYRQ